MSVAELHEDEEEESMKNNVGPLTPGGPVQNSFTESPPYFEDGPVYHRNRPTISSANLA